MATRHSITCLLCTVVLAINAHGQDDAATSDYYRDQDTPPGVVEFYRQLPGGEDTWWGIGPSKPKVKRSSFKPDAHEGVEDYSPELLCQKCHAPETKDLHGLRMGITCVQCHRNQPVSGVYEYYSPLNPIRRHAYVCAKCHEGASASFATYVVHEPNPISSEARESFPLLYYSVWFMLILAGGVLVLFLPFTLIWWIRDLVANSKRGGGHE